MKDPSVADDVGTRRLVGIGLENTARRSRITLTIVVVLETPRCRCLSIPCDGLTVVGSKSEYGLYIVL